LPDTILGCFSNPDLVTVGEEMLAEQRRTHRVGLDDQDATAP